MARSPYLYIFFRAACLPFCLSSCLPRQPQDHIGASRLVSDHFEQKDSMAPTVISSSRIRKALNDKNYLSPTSVWYNNRQVRIPEKMSQSEYKHIMVGGLTAEVTKLHAHVAGDVLVYFDKAEPGNAAQGE